MKPTAGSSHSREKKPCIISEAYWKLHGTSEFFFHCSTCARQFFFKKTLPPAVLEPNVGRRKEGAFYARAIVVVPAPPCPRRGIGQGKLSLSLSLLSLWMGRGGRERWRRRRRYWAVCQEEGGKAGFANAFSRRNFLKGFSGC